MTTKKAVKKAATRKTQAKKANAPVKNAPVGKSPRTKIKAVASEAARTKAKKATSAPKKPAAKRVGKNEKSAARSLAHAKQLKQHFATMKKPDKLYHLLIEFFQSEMFFVVAGKRDEEQVNELLLDVSRTVTRIKKKQGWTHAADRADILLAFMKIQAALMTALHGNKEQFRELLLAIANTLINTMEKQGHTFK